MKLSDLDIDYREFLIKSFNIKDDVLNILVENNIQPNFTFDLNENDLSEIINFISEWKNYFKIRSILKKNNIDFVKRTKKLIFTLCVTTGLTFAAMCIFLSAIPSLLLFASIVIVLKVMYITSLHTSIKNIDDDVSYYDINNQILLSDEILSLVKAKQFSNIKEQEDNMKLCNNKKIVLEEEVILKYKKEVLSIMCEIKKFSVIYGCDISKVSYNSWSLVISELLFFLDNKGCSNKEEVTVKFLIDVIDNFYGIQSEDDAWNLIEVNNILEYMILLVKFEDYNVNFLTEKFRIDIYEVNELQDSIKTRIKSNIVKIDDFRNK